MRPNPLSADIARCRQPCACPGTISRHHCARFVAEIVDRSPVTIGTPCPGWIPLRFGGVAPGQPKVKPWPGE